MAAFTIHDPQCTILVETDETGKTGNSLRVATNGNKFASLSHFLAQKLEPSGSRLV